MKRPFNILACALAAALPALLGACAAPEPTSSAAASGTSLAAADGKEEEETLTGSRLPRKTTERLLRRTDAAGAREMDRNRPPEKGQTFN